VVTGFHPAVGPVSGGSRLTVIGRHLDVGSHVTALLTNGENATVHCQLYGKQLPTSVVCITGSSTKPAVMNYLVLSIDSARVNFAGRFDFVADPVIEIVMPFKTIIRYKIIIIIRYLVIIIVRYLVSVCIQLNVKITQFTNILAV